MLPRRASTIAGKGRNRLFGATPYSFGREILCRIIPPQPSHVVYVDHIERRGIDLFSFVCESDLEGIVAKHKDGV
jgi:hypothetical protein